MAPKLSRDAHKYEAHYAATYRRIHDGKFIVHLPLNCSPSTLGESTDQPTRLAIEAQLSRNEWLQKEYRKGMQEYLEQNHMELVPKQEFNQLVSYYLPYHSVIKESSSTTKVGIVFDVSAKTIQANLYKWHYESWASGTKGFIHNANTTGVAQIRLYRHNQMHVLANFVG